MFIQMDHFLSLPNLIRIDRNTAGNGLSLQIYNGADSCLKLVAILSGRGITSRAEFLLCHLEPRPLRSEGTLVHHSLCLCTSISLSIPRR